MISSSVFFDRNYQLATEIVSGMVIGLWISFVAVFLFSRISNISFTSSRFVLGSIEISFVSTLCRIIAFLVPLGIAVFILMFWFDSRVIPTIYNRRSNIYFIRLTVIYGIPLTLLVGAQFRLMVSILDSRLGFDVKKLDSAEWIKKLSVAEDNRQIDFHLERAVLKKIVFVTSLKNIEIEPLCYGGLVSRPRLLLPKRYLESDLDQGWIQPIAKQVSRIRRRDSLFQTIFLLFVPQAVRTLLTQSTFFKGLLFPFYCLLRVEEWHNDTCEALCRAEPLIFSKSYKRLHWGVLYMIAIALGALGLEQIRSSILYHQKYKTIRSKTSKDSVL